MQKTGNPVFCFLPFLAFSRFSPRHLCASVPLRWGLKSNAIALSLSEHPDGALLNRVEWIIVARSFGTCG